MSLIEDFIEYYPRKSDKTKKDRRMVMNLFKEYIDKPLEEGKRKDVQNWIRHLENNGCKSSSINQYVSHIKRFYKWLRHELPNPVGEEEMREVFEKQRQFERIEDIERLEMKQPEEIAFEPDEIIKLVKNIKRKYRIKIAILNPYFGLRRDELRLLTKDYVDFDEKTITIRRKTTKKPWSAREIPFHPIIGKILDSSKGKYVIGGKKPYGQSTFSTWKDYYNIVGSEFSQKSFRKTFDTNQKPILEDKFGITLGDYLLKKLMGHKTSGDDMSEHYFSETKSFDDHKREAMTSKHFFSQNGIFEELEDIIESF